MRKRAPPGRRAAVSAPRAREVGQRRDELRQLDLARDAELGVDVLDMPLDGVPAPARLRRDPVDGPALGQRDRDAALGGGQAERLAHPPRVDGRAVGGVDNQHQRADAGGLDAGVVHGADMRDRPRPGLQAAERHRTADAGPVAGRQGARDQPLERRILPGQRGAQAAALVAEPVAPAQQRQGAVVDGDQPGAAVELDDARADVVEQFDQRRAERPGLEQRVA